MVSEPREVVSELISPCRDPCRNEKNVMSSYQHSYVAQWCHGWPTNRRLVESEDAILIIAMKDWARAAEPMQPQTNCMKYGLHFFELDVLASVTCRYASAENVLNVLQKARMSENVAP